MRPVIAVGVGGRGAVPAVNWAIDEAASRGARLLLGHACSPQSPLALRTPMPSADLLDLFNPQLGRTVAGARRQLGGDRVDFRILPGRPEHALVDLAADADLLVLGPPSHQLPRGLGSTVHRLAAHLPCPLAVIRSVEPGPVAPMRGAVVVGVDGSPASAGALEFGFAWADAHRCGLVAVHVTHRKRDDYWFDQTTLSTHFSVAPAELELLFGEVEPWTHKYPGTQVRYAVYGGRPLPGLLRAADGARLLVVGDHGTGAASRALLGSVSHNLIDRAAGPVVVARSLRDPRMAGVVRSGTR